MKRFRAILIEIWTVYLVSLLLFSFPFPPSFPHLHTSQISVLSEFSRFRTHQPMDGVLEGPDSYEAHEVFVVVVVGNYGKGVIPCPGA